RVARVPLRPVAAWRRVVGARRDDPAHQRRPGAAFLGLEVRWLTGVVRARPATVDLRLLSWPAVAGWLGLRGVRLFLLPLWALCVLLHEAFRHIAEVLHHLLSCVTVHVRARPT